MIIFGSRMYGKKFVVEGWGYCDNCRKYVKTSNYNAREWGHIYFIPIIPSKTPMRVIRECSKCHRGNHIPEIETPAILNELKTHSDNALSALIDGEKVFSDNGKEISYAASLANNVELLYCLNEADYVSKLIENLQAHGLNYTLELVTGKSLEFQGKFDEAMHSYRQAALHEPQEVAPLLYFGLVYLRQKDYIRARPIYEKALELTDDKISVLQILLMVYENIKDHGALAETYEEIYKISPNISQDKKIMKAYNKACNKAGREPMIKT